MTPPRTVCPRPDRGRRSSPSRRPVTPPPKERTPAMTYRVRNIGIAVALALVAALLTTFYVSNYRRHVQRQQAATPVLVAVRDIPAGTPGTAIAAGHFVAVQNVVEKNRVPGAFTAPEQLTRLVATQQIFEGEQVSTRRFGTVEQTGIRSQLTGTLRGFEVDGDQNQMLAGVLKAGDHVDLVAALKKGIELRPAQPRRPAEPQGAAGAAVAGRGREAHRRRGPGLQRDPRAHRQPVAEVPARRLEGERQRRLQRRHDLASRPAPAAEGRRQPGPPRQRQHGARRRDPARRSATKFLGD